jgi:ATP-dependent helicase/nuclease subunit A
MKWTPSQWEAITTTDRHLLVTAGAGTGKTSTVVGHILYLLGAEFEGRTHAEPLALNEIAAITYTNAAAADLKRQLRAGLRETGRRTDAWGVDNARIGTIHSFCGDILREFALRSGRSPGGRVLDEAESVALAADVARETLALAMQNGQDGLEALLATRSLRDIESWLGRLLAESDRLRRIAARRESLGPSERALADLALIALDELERRLEASGAADFDRLIVGARDLLRDSLEVRRTLQRQLRLLIVDEFQDVDPVQKEIAYLLGAPGSGRSGSCGTGSIRLMLVGDPKQSIYRFRHADVTVWTAVEQDFRVRGHGRVVTLQENFRSPESVLAFVDATVGRILDCPANGTAHQPFEIPYQPLLAGEQHPPLPAGGVELLVVPDAGLTADGVRAAEAEALARRVVELERGGVPWSEMAILLGSWSALDLYQGALERAGVRTYALRSEGFYECREVVDLIVALETVRDPTDDRALLGFLRSPFVGVRDETLLAIARQCTSPYWTFLPEVETAERTLLESGIELIARHAALRDRIPTHELLQSLLLESGYLGHLVLLGEPGQQALANVRKFSGIARGHAAMSVGEFLRVVGDLRASGSRVGEARLHGDRDDVVTITSIHSAKGLQWRVVFWCDLVRGAPPSYSGDLLIGRDTLVLRDPDLKPDEQSEAWRALKGSETDEETAERKRLWYVAATRAKERLIVSGIYGGKLRNEGSTASYALRELIAPPIEDGAGATYVGQDGRRFEATVRLAPGLAPEADKSLDAQPKLLTLPSALSPLSVPAGRRRHSASELLALARCARRHWLRYVVGLREPPVERSGSNFESAVVRGQIVHDVLEHLDEETELERVLEEAIGHWAEDAPGADLPDGTAFRRRIRGELDAVLGNAAYAKLFDHPGARRELGFLHVTESADVAEGRIDLAVSREDGLVLVDVKTSDCGRAAAEARAREYAPQRDVYISAVEAIGGLPVSTFAFQFPAAGQVAESITDETRTNAGAAFVAACEQIAIGAAPLTAHPTECLYCGYRKVGWCAGVKQPVV